MSLEGPTGSVEVCIIQPCLFPECTVHCLELEEEKEVWAFNRACGIRSPEKRCCTGLGKRQGRENKASQTDEYTGQTRD